MGVTLQSWTRLKITWESLQACLAEKPKTNLVLNSQNNRQLQRFTSLVLLRMKARSEVELHSLLRTFQKFKLEQVPKWTYWIDRVRVLQPTLVRIKNSRPKDHQEVWGQYKPIRLSRFYKTTWCTTWSPKQIVRWARQVQTNITQTQQLVEALTRNNFFLREMQPRISTIILPKIHRSLL